MILELLKNLFSSEQKCQHSHVGIDKDFGYCPDCGALIENQWYIVRCACCGIKKKAIVKNGKIVPISNFCHNCGSEEYIVEKLDTIDFININYAVLIRKETETRSARKITQCWVDAREKTFEQPLLLPQFQ